MKKRVYDYINKYDLLQAGANVLVGVSGGADSVCLLLMLKEWARDNSGEVYAVHVNHCIRGDEAARDQKFVEGLCGELGVELRVETVDVPKLAAQTGMSLEEAGREARYKAFFEFAAEKRCSVVAVAHHRDDAAETVLMNIMRGTGVEGLSGLSPVRSIKTEEAGVVTLIRPLLCAGKAEIIEWLNAKGQSWCEDSTNTEPDVTRNRVRLELLPLMESIRPGAAEGILRMAGLAAEAADFMSDAAEDEYEKAIKSAEPAVELDVDALRMVSPTLTAIVIKKAVAQARGDVQDITLKHLDMIKGLIERDDDAASHLPGLLVRRMGGRLVFETASREEKEAASKAVGIRGIKRSVLSVKCSVHDASERKQFSENSYIILCDYDKISHTVEIRNRREGDYITLSGGGTKLLRRWFIDEKISREERDDIQVAADGSHIIWIVGRRFNDFYKVEPTTKRIFVMEASDDCSEGGNC